MKVIGLCGGSGSGKGVVSALFRTYGFFSIDTDDVYHELISHTSDLTIELTEAFGKEILSLGKVDRKALSAIVFSGDNSSEKLELLNKITHKHILDEVRERLFRYKSEGARYVIVDAPLLFESGFDKECDIIISVIADKATRICRIMQRDDISYDAAERRLMSQIDDNWLSENSDFIIENNLDKAALAATVEKIYKQISDNY